MAAHIDGSAISRPVGSCGEGIQAQVGGRVAADVDAGAVRALAGVSLREIVICVRPRHEQWIIGDIAASSSPVLNAAVVGCRAALYLGRRITPNDAVCDGSVAVIQPTSCAPARVVGDCAG